MSVEERPPFYVYPGVELMGGSDSAPEWSKQRDEPERFQALEYEQYPSPVNV